jgi:hypothetical protein
LGLCQRWAKKDVDVYAWSLRIDVNIEIVALCEKQETKLGKLKPLPFVRSLRQDLNIEILYLL